MIQRFRLRGDLRSGQPWGTGWWRWTDLLFPDREWGVFGPDIFQWGGSVHRVVRISLGSEGRNLESCSESGIQFSKLFLWSAIPYRALAGEQKGDIGNKGGERWLLPHDSVSLAPSKMPADGECQRRESTEAQACVGEQGVSPGAGGFYQPCVECRHLQWIEDQGSERGAWRQEWEKILV